MASQAPGHPLPDGRGSESARLSGFVRKKLMTLCLASRRVWRQPQGPECRVSRLQTYRIQRKYTSWVVYCDFKLAQEIVPEDAVELRANRRAQHA